MTEEKTATCKNCGHTWKPRNTSTPNHKRKCGKCGSEDIELKTAESPAPENEQPTQQEIKDLINKKPEDNKAKEKITPDNTETETAKNTAPKIHPTLLTIILIFVLGIGGIIYFLRATAKTRNKRIQKTQEEEKPARTPNKPKKGIVGL